MSAYKHMHMLHTRTFNLLFFWVRYPFIIPILINKPAPIAFFARKRFVAWQKPTKS